MSSTVFHAPEAQSSKQPALALATPRIVREDRPDGSFVLRSEEPLKPYDRCVGDWLVRWAGRTPDRIFLAERAPEEGVRWRTLTYGQTYDQVRRLAQGLLDLDLPPDRPIVSVSDNSVNLALLGLAAMYIGRTIAMVSPSYIRMTRNYDKAHGILRTLKPALLYAEDGDVYRAALDTSGQTCPLVYTRNVPDTGMPFDALLAVAPDSEVDRLFELVQPDHPAKLLLTSGSTGRPKIVVNTHRMLCANQQMVVQTWPFVDEAAPRIVDWLPWSHTFGSNHNFNMMLRNGGSLYIDDGRPVPGLIERSVENIHSVRPTLYFNVPRGFDALLGFLEKDPDFARDFFAELDLLFYAGAALPLSIWQKYEALAKPWRSKPLFFTTSWGATETSPLITTAHFVTSHPANIGVPVPGAEVKFVPNQGRYELRARGLNVFKEYLDDPERTREAFDEEGFYRLGDAGKLADPNNPSAGIIFDGRVAEDFKLTTGTWVAAGNMRLKALSALTPLAQDVVVAGHNREEVGLMLFPTPALRALAGDTEGKLDGMELGKHPAVRERIRQLLEPIYEGAGSSQRARRVVILSSPPSLDDGEITDKGYVNQRAVLERRAADVERLYSDDASVIRLS